ncbi:MAG: hypothetical protein RPU13_15710 [Candidatus Sedimenticola sp. (ex Thyasira tokunagai)]
MEEGIGVGLTINQTFVKRLHGRCQPWRAKRRLVIPGSREAALLTRRARSVSEGMAGHQ